MLQVKSYLNFWMMQDLKLDATDFLKEGIHVKSRHQFL